MSKKDLIKFSTIMILLTIGIAVLILLFCWVCYLLPYDFPGTVGEWITALSALAGGSLTLVGVWWTIKYEKDVHKSAEKEHLKQKEEDFRIKHLPFMKISTLKSDSSFSNVTPKMFKLYISFVTKIEDDLKVIPNQLVYLKLSNVGLGVAENISFTFGEIKFYKNASYQILEGYELEIKSLFEKSYIVNNDFEIIPMLVKFNNSNQNNNGYFIQPFLATNLIARGKIVFYDSSGNKYYQNLNLHFAIRFEENPIRFKIEVMYIYLENIVLTKDN